MGGFLMFHFLFFIFYFWEQLSKQAIGMVNGWEGDFFFCLFCKVLRLALILTSAKRVLFGS